MWKFNGCPRCDRDVFIYQTVNGIYYEKCFRCGHRANLDSSVKAEQVLSEAIPMGKPRESP